MRIAAAILILCLIGCEQPLEQPNNNMPTPINPASPLQITQTFNGPADGDLASAASVNTGFQALLTSVEGLRHLTYGGGFKARVVALTNNILHIYPLGAVIAKSGGIWTVVPHTTMATINPQALAGGSFASNTRYYVYVSISSGSLVWSVSTTGPDIGLRYKAGDEQYLFVTSFYADKNNNLLPYTQEGNTYSYTNLTPLGSGVHGNVLLDGGTNTIPTSILLVGGAIPNGATMYTLLGSASTTTGSGSATLGSAGVNSRRYYVVAPGQPATGEATFNGQIASMPYNVNAPTTAFSVWALSFTW